MATEIERKFLVNGDVRSQATEHFNILQGYISSVPERIVRVRIKGDQGYITIKGISNETGLKRFEWDKEIPLLEAELLLELCEPHIIHKTRYLIPAGKHTFEVDEFHGYNEGLVIAEMELERENEVFEKPEWLGSEVTGQRRYYNDFLSKRPYKMW